MPRYRILIASALVLVLVSLSAFAGATFFRSSGRADEVTLPTACENLVAATKLLAEHGSVAALPMSNPDVFTGNPDTRRYDTLKALLDACDAELAMMAPRS